MAMIIDEIVAEILPDPAPIRIAGASPHLADDAADGTEFDLFTIAHEREERLAID